MMHGHVTPDGSEEVSWLATPETLSQVFGDPSFDLTVTAHTHFAFAQREGDRFIANSGSMTVPHIWVILPDGSRHCPAGKAASIENSDFRSSYLIVTEKDGSIEVQVARFDFDRQGVMDRLAKVEGLTTTMEYWRKLMKEGISDTRSIYA